VKRPEHHADVVRTHESPVGLAKQGECIPPRPMVTAGTEDARSLIQTCIFNPPS
jgi:hypothetical protein